MSDYLDRPNVYPAGRLDADSEGLLLLTDDGKLQQEIANPLSKKPKTYLVQVEGSVSRSHLERLANGLNLGDFVSAPCKAIHVAEPTWLWLRDPPIRVRKNQATDWVAITLTEGKNRQVRRMTAAVGLPTLRLIRIAIGPFSLESHPLLPGDWVDVSSDPANLKPG